MCALIAFFAPLSRVTRRDITATHLPSLVFLLENNCTRGKIVKTHRRALTQRVRWADSCLRISTSSRLVPNERLSMMMGRGGREVEYLPCDPRVAGSISTLAICVTSLSKMFALTCSDTLSWHTCMLKTLTSDAYGLHLWNSLLTLLLYNNVKPLKKCKL